MAQQNDATPAAFLPALRRLALSAALACCLLVPARADQIVLKDGDRITGEIVKKEKETVTVKSKNFGLVTLNWDDIATIRTDQPLNVLLTDQTLKGNIETRDNRIQIEVPGASRTVAPGDIVALRNDAEESAYQRLLRPGLLDLWTITGSLNIAGATGNAETSTLTTPVNFLRASNTSRTTAYFNSIRSTATVEGISAETARAVRGGWGYNRNLTKKVFADVFNDFEYDQFQSLDLRIVLGGGLGYQIWTGESARLAAVAGAAWNREKFSPTTGAAFVRNSGEAYWGNDFNSKLTTRMTLVQSFRMFNNLSETGQYRVNFDIGATTQLTKWLHWNVSLGDRYLSNPVPGRKNNDLLYTIGFGFTFSR